MKNNNSDIFIGIKQPNSQTKNDNNFFMFDENLVFEDSKKLSSEPSRRLNDYDFNLLKEDAYKDVDSDVFKLEYKIAKTEEDIKTLTNQLILAEEIQDYNLTEDLKTRLEVLKEDYTALLAMYNEKSLSAKITDTISSFLGNNTKSKFTTLKNNLSKFSNKFIDKLPKNLKTILELKKSLETLENINKSVDDLMTLNIPYGEQYNKYEQLSKFIIKANSIQAEISQNIKKR